MGDDSEVGGDLEVGQCGRRDKMLTFVNYVNMVKCKSSVETCKIRMKYRIN